MHLLIRPFRAVIVGTHWRRASDSAALSGCWPRSRDWWVAVACQKPSLLFKPPPQSHQWGRDREGSWFSRALLDAGLLIPFSWCLCRALLSSGSEWESEAFILTSTTGAGRVTATFSSAWLRGGSLLGWAAGDIGGSCPFAEGPRREGQPSWAPPASNGATLAEVLPGLSSFSDVPACP